MAKKISLDFGKIKEKIADFFRNFRNLPRDEQYAYVAIGAGVIFIIIGLIL